MLNPMDARVFALLESGGSWRTRVLAEQLERSPMVARRSLRRLADAGLAVETIGRRRGFATGSGPSLWTVVPGARFPGVTPWGERETRPPAVAKPAPYIPPQPVTAAPTLAGTVAQTMRGKT